MASPDEKRDRNHFKQKKRQPSRKQPGRSAGALPCEDLEVRNQNAILQRASQLAVCTAFVIGELLVVFLPSPLLTSKGANEACIPKSHHKLPIRHGILAEGRPALS